MRYPSVHARRSPRRSSCARTSSLVREASQVVPASTPPSQPYWLRTEGTAGLFDVDDPSLIGRAREPARVPDRVRLRRRRADAGDRRRADAGRGSRPRPALRRRLEVIAPVSLRFIAGVRLFAPGAARPVTVELTAARARAVGTVQLDAPAGWIVTPASQPFRLAAPGAHARFTFTVTAPPQLATAPLGASVEINGRRFNQQRIEVRYDHLPLQLLQPPARARGGVARAGDARPPRRLPAGRRRRRGRRPGADGLRGHVPDRRRPDAGTAARPRRGGHRHPRLQRADGSRRAPARRCSRTSRRAARSSRSTTRWTACARAGSRRSSCTSRATA